MCHDNCNFNIVNVCLFGLILYISVNSYGHVEMVSSDNHTFSWASLTKRLTSTSCTLLLVADNKLS